MNGKVLVQVFLCALGLCPSCRIGNDFMSIKGELLKSAPFALRVMWLGLILGPVFWVLLNTSKFAGVNSTEAASWVQAFGSIAALIGTAVVANWQMRNAQRQSDSEKAERQRAMYAVVHSAVEWASSAGSFVEKSPGDWYFRDTWSSSLGSSFSASLQALVKVPAHELGGPRLVVQFVSIVGAMENVKVAVDKYMSSNPNRKDTIEFYELVEAQLLTLQRSWAEFIKISSYDPHLHNLIL